MLFVEIQRLPLEQFSPLERAILLLYEPEDKNKKQIRYLLGVHIRTVQKAVRKYEIVKCAPRAARTLVIVA